MVYYLHAAFVMCMLLNPFNEYWFLFKYFKESLIKHLVQVYLIEHYAKKGYYKISLFGRTVKLIPAKMIILAEL